MRYIKQESGLLVPDGVRSKGVYRIEHFRRGELIDDFEAENVCVAEGLIFLLNLGFTGGSNVSGWYAAVYSNNYTPVSTDTAATIVGNSGEFTGYSGGARPNYQPAAATQPTPSINNSASKATFTFTGSATLYGAFIISSATPGSASGTLYSAVLFPSSKTVGNTDQMLLTYTLSLNS